MKRIVAMVLIVSLVLVGINCAKQPNRIDAAYVSPNKYRNFDCQQLAEEMDHVSRRLNELHASIKKEATKDAWAMGIGIVLFWPALFFLSGGDGPEATEYAQLKGDYEALRQTMIEKKCAAEIPPSPESQPKKN